MARSAAVVSLASRAGVNRGNQRLQVGFPCELGVETLEPLRGVEEQRRSVAAAAEVKGNLGAHAFYLGSTELVERACVRGRQQRLCSREVSSLELRSRGSERP